MRRFLGACSFVSLLLACAIASAEPFPDHAIRIIVPLAAGGGADQMTRIMAAGLATKIGRPVVIENHGGAGGTVGMEYGARAPADGYTLTMVYQSMAANPYLYKHLGFDTVKDFAPITLMVYYQLVLAVNNAVPARNIRELIALAKSKPGALTFGSSGTGGASHLAFVQFMSRTGTQFLHVPYKGNAPAMTDLIAGRLTAIADALVGVEPFVRSGQIRALGVLSQHRSVLMPDVPSISETVPGYEMQGWLGMVAPAHTPPDRIAYLNKAIASVLNDPAIKQHLVQTGNEIVAGTPQQFAPFLQSELHMYQTLIREAGIKPE